MEYRNSAITGLNVSSAQLVFNRRLRTKLPISKNLLKTKIVKNLVSNLKQRQNRQKYYFDKIVKKLKPLNLGEKVFVQDKKNKT